ncbi:hypothetical protein BN381_300028 [Candidatus Microthrix parvicella RN1]|uniref:Uncharacterized protein n=1 Tax=Candidatus Neomicrothrix parvicella RN1 TaxID=1229780 RepID=R4Z3L8_9ACTN|nr:hypothetical protein BN381_300028 [Candidatus Microthrix parvicella RN1]
MVFVWGAVLRHAALPGVERRRPNPPDGGIT